MRRFSYPHDVWSVRFNSAIGTKSGRRFISTVSGNKINRTTSEVSGIVFGGPISISSGRKLTARSICSSVGPQYIW